MREANQSEKQVDAAPQKSKLRTLMPHLAVFCSFGLPTLMLYFLSPESFEISWTGHLPLLIFMWLFALEFALAWTEIGSAQVGTCAWARSFASILSMALPTIYVLSVAYSSGCSSVLDLGRLLGIPYYRFGAVFLLENWPLAFEYVFLAVSFLATILLIYSFKGLRRFAVSLFFLGATAFFFTRLMGLTHTVFLFFCRLLYPLQLLPQQLC